MRRNILIVVCIMVMGAGLSACSDLPQIHLLHDPLTAKEHVMLGLTYESQGYRRLAAQEYRTALTQEAGFVPALIGLGNVAFAEGEMEKSEAYYQLALTASPDHPGANNNLAMLYLARGDSLDEAERLALRALAQRGPLRPYVLDTLARVYAQQGRYMEAVTTLEEAEVAAPSQDRILHERLIRLRNQLVNFRSQADQRRAVQPVARQNPEHDRDGPGEEQAISPEGPAMIQARGVLFRVFLLPTIV